VTGSRDNISVVAVRLPGARKAAVDLGGVNRRRADRQRAQNYNYNSANSLTGQGYYYEDDDDDE